MMSSWSSVYHLLTAQVSQSSSKVGESLDDGKSYTTRYRGEEAGKAKPGQMESEEHGGDRNLSRPLRLPRCASHPDGTAQQSDRCHHPAIATASPIGVALCHWSQCNFSPYRYTDEKERGNLVSWVKTPCQQNRWFNNAPLLVSFPFVKWLDYRLLHTCDPLD
jgi:hypothetical protein